MHLINDGKTYSEIAKILEISKHTVQDYLRSLRLKLNCSTLAQAVGKAKTPLPVNRHAKMRHLKRLKLNCLKDDTAKSAGEMRLQIARSSAGFAGASAY